MLLKLLRMSFNQSFRSFNQKEYAKNENFKVEHYVTVDVANFKLL